MSTAHTPGPLDIDATIVGPVIELRYASHSEAMRQLRILRERLAVHDELLAALIVAREFVSTDRNSLFDSVEQADGTVAPDDAEAVADYDKALLQIAAAIKAADRTREI
jgi:hypothetical protein